MTSFLHTQDGTVLVYDPTLGLISAASMAEAQAEIRRRLAAKLQSPKAACNLNQPVTITVGVNA